MGRFLVSLKLLERYPKNSYLWAFCILATLRDRKTNIMPEALFGVSGKSNRDTKRKSHWGKNEFNSSFPTSLLCYMSHLNVKPVYLKLRDDLSVLQDSITVEQLFGVNPSSETIYFSFEDGFPPHQEFVVGQLPRNDLVIQNTAIPDSPWKRGFEIKLTALPDSSTFRLAEEDQSCEMVFRPPAIVHLAISIASVFKERRSELATILAPVCSRIFNWRVAEEVVGVTNDLVTVLNDSFLNLLDHQEPFVIQPIWRTIRKTSVLHENCLDVFVWSNFAFTRLFIDMYVNANKGGRKAKMTRHQRCIFWLARMLYDFAQTGRINEPLVRGEMAYQLQTDKAFSISGKLSWKYLHGDVLSKPRVTKSQLKEIILNGGHNLLSPERRFDAAVVNTLGLFQAEANQ